MAERYHVGNTPQTRHLIRDDEQGTTMALATTAGVAQRIVRALNLVETLDKDSTPQRFQLQDDGTYRDSGSLPPLPNPLPPAECWDVAARQYLSDLFSFLCQPGTDAVPSPPWMP